MNGNYDHELIMTQREYERTGKQIRIPEDELISIVLDRIDYYLTLHPRERRNYPDPRKDPVVTRIASGKTIEVPQQIVDKALEIHQACGRVGTVERMESVGKTLNDDLPSGHTRVAKRDRYAVTDPFVMNKEIRDSRLRGRDGRMAGDPRFQDFPQRYNDFNRGMAKYIDRNNMGSDLNDRSDPYNTNLHSLSDTYDEQSRENVGSFKYGRGMVHKSGPSKSSDYMDDVVGMDSDISPESDSASVYAPLDEADDQKSGSSEEHHPVMRPDIVDDRDYEDDPDYNCDSCGHNDGYRGNYPYHSRMHPAEYDNGAYDHRNYSDEYPPMNGTYVPESGYDEQEETRFAVDDEGNYVGNEDRDSKKLVENYSNGTSTYNYALWLLLIILLVILYMKYIKKNETGRSAGLVPQ